MQSKVELNQAVDSVQEKYKKIKPRLISYIASFEGFKKTDGFNLSNINKSAIILSQSSIAEECGRHFSHMNPSVAIAWPVLFEITDNSPYLHVDSPSLWLVDFNGEQYLPSKLVKVPG